MLITFENVVQQFFFTGKNVPPANGPDDGWNASPGEKPLNAHHTTTSVHRRYHLEMDCVSS